MSDLITINKEIITGLNKRYFIDDKMEKQFKAFCELEILKNIQTLQTMDNISDKLFKNVRFNRDLPHKDAIDLFNAGHGQKAVLMAFGPSLRYTKKKILAVKTKYQIIGVDRGFYWYEKTGIPTDYITACDVDASPEWIPHKLLNGKKLIVFAGCNHEFCWKWVELGGELYFYTTNCRAGTHHKINEIMPVKCCIPGSGNIGQIQLVLSIALMNFKKVFLVGYDNSWGDYYYPDKRYDGRENQAFKIKGIDGKEVFVTLAWQLLTQHIYDFIRDYQVEDRVINCTEHGAIKLKNHSELT